MKDVFVVNKKEGETPLESLESFRVKKKIGTNVPMTYAGRLDPMAEGVLVLLSGEECKQKERYLKLDKEYEFTVLFGFATDTYDILGKVQHSYILENVDISEMEKHIKKNLKYFKGKIMQKYPMYSSKTVAGKHLHEYARAGEEVESPEQKVEVKSLKYLKLKKINSQKLLQNIEGRIALVNGYFRQSEIIKIWRKTLKNPSSYFVADFRARVSSGTYTRAIANDLGIRIGTPALALKINRTKVGNFAKILR